MSFSSNYIGMVPLILMCTANINPKSNTLLKVTLSLRYLSKGDLQYEKRSTFAIHYTHPS
jgi:hypothetical protein